MKIRISKADLATCIENISRAIRSAQEEEEAIEVRSDGLRRLIQSIADDAFEEILESIAEYEREAQRIQQQIKYYVEVLNQAIRMIWWLQRNASAGRSNTSAVSDMLLLTIPTPPTAETANCSLWQRGMTCEAAA